MSQLLRALGLGILVLVFVVGVGVSGDAKKDKEPGKKASIPTGWKVLKLSKEQHEKVLGIATKYNAKIAALQAQIDDLKTQRLAEQVKILNADQKATLLKGLGGEFKEKVKSNK